MPACEASRFRERFCRIGAVGESSCEGKGCGALVTTTPAPSFRAEPGAVDLQDHLHGSRWEEGSPGGWSHAGETDPTETAESIAVFN